MKIVAIIPIKKKSKRIKGKNFKKINTQPLYTYLLSEIKKCNFDDVYIDSDSTQIKKYSKKKGFKFIQRKPFLALDNANGNDLLNYHSKLIDADIYFQLFITSPTLKFNTINKCINILKRSKKYDSIFTCKKIYSWFWFNRRPVNYQPKVLPRSQDAKPIVQETTGLYGIRKESLKKYKCRIGKKPYFYEVQNKESLDIDDLEDLNFFKFIKKK